MDNPALPPSDLQTVRPLHLTLVSLATCLLPSVVLPLCQHYWAFLLSFGAVGFLTGQDLSVYSYLDKLIIIYCCLVARAGGGLRQPGAGGHDGAALPLCCLLRGVR